MITFHGEITSLGERKCNQYLYFYLSGLWFQQISNFSVSFSFLTSCYQENLKDNKKAIVKKFENVNKNKIEKKTTKSTI